MTDLVRLMVLGYIMCALNVILVTLSIIKMIICTRYLKNFGKETVLKVEETINSFSKVEQWVAYGVFVSSIAFTALTFAI